MYSKVTLSKPSKRSWPIVHKLAGGSSCCLPGLRYWRVCSLRSNSTYPAVALWCRRTSCHCRTMQLSHISIFAFHLLLHQTNLVSSSQCIRKVFQECKGYRATSNLIYSTEKADFDGCQRACLLEPICNGFNIIWQTDNPKPRECQLLRLSIPLKDFTEDDTTSFFCE